MEQENIYNQNNTENPQYEGMQTFSENVWLKQQKLQHKHEESIMQNSNTHEEELLSKNLGIIGRLFGSGDNSSKNITATICGSLLIGATIISCFVYFKEKDTTFIKSIWNNILPIITLSLGYLFGKK